MADALFKAENARLITRTSSERAGLGDYRVKRGFRRELDVDMRREGYDYFWPDITGDFASDPGDQPFPWQTPPEGESPAAEPITFIGRAERPNGEHAILAGSKTKLWRYVAASGGGYAETGVFETSPSANAPYAEEEMAAQWILIGSGFSSSGHRWEHLNIDGSTILNNGVDLPVSFRLEETEVKPIYELRDQGIASVGTIGELSGILMACDISEIQQDSLLALMELPGDITTDITASQSGTTVTLPADFFTSDHVDMWLVREGQDNMQITAVTDARTATVDTSATIASSRFRLRYAATQIGSTFSDQRTGTVASGDNTVVASQTIFDIGMEGKTIRFADGFSSVIATYTNSTNVEIVDAPDYDISGLPFWVTDADFSDNATTSDKLTTEADFFTSDMVGRTVIFDSGEARLITKYIDARNVKVDLDLAITETLFRLNNTSAYAAYTDEATIDRVQYRALWAMPNLPRRFGVRVPVTVEEGSQTVTLAYPAQSFEVGDEVTIVGAGLNGGNLSTSILAINGVSIQIADVAETEITEFGLEGLILHTDSIGSIVGFEDLQNDSSSILRALKLGKRTLVIYKDSCIFLATYTGDADAPFSFELVTIPRSVALRYRWSLIDAGGMFHVYAGSNSFYKLDLSTQRPQIIPELDLISDRFFDEVDLTDQEEVFAADNTVSNEVFLWFPGSGDDKALCFDYKHSSASTIDYAMSGAGSVKKPTLGLALGATEDLFLMGTSAGTVVIYGRADSPHAAWGSDKEIYYRRSAYPFSATKSGYQSKLSSGWGDFGSSKFVKDLMGYVLYLASQSPNAGLLVKIYGARNPSEPETLLIQEYIESPRTENMVSSFLRSFFFRYDLEISGLNNPVRIASHSWDVEALDSGQTERREQ